jgi:hypothetical protein
MSQLGVMDEGKIVSQVGASRIWVFGLPPLPMYVGQWCKF